MHLNDFKSHWYYWHTGHKRIAIFSMATSAVIMSLVLVVTVGFSPWGIVLAVLLDAAGFWLAVIYLVFIRSQLSEFMGLKSHIDLLILTQLALPLLAGFFISRLSSFSIAKLFSFRPTPRH